TRKLYTVSARLAELDPAEFFTVSFTTYVPDFENRWLGFFTVDVFTVPEAVSPKIHDHEVGEPVDVSVNCSVRTFPEDATPKEATGATTRAATEIVFVVEPLPPALVAFKVTV